MGLKNAISILPAADLTWCVLCGELGVKNALSILVAADLTWCELYGWLDVNDALSMLSAADHNWCDLYGWLGVKVKRVSHLICSRPHLVLRLWFVDTVLLLCPSLPTEILNWLSSLPILMQKSFWWWQCSDRYIISLSPHLHTPFPPFCPSLISLMVSVDVKHHVYLLT